MGRGESWELYRKMLRSDAAAALENAAARRIFGFVMAEHFYREPTLALGQGGGKTTAYREGRRAAALGLANLLASVGTDAQEQCVREYRHLKAVIDTDTDTEEDDDEWL